MEPLVDGFAVSSLFEAQLAKCIAEEKKEIHFTTPGLRREGIDSLFKLCNRVSFNSLSQFMKYKDYAGKQTSCGLRINPELSFIRDNRYDPCRKYSKLGVPLSALKSLSLDEMKSLEDCRGLHFHSNCESTEFGQLVETVNHIYVHIPESLKRVDWVNIGGGYLFDGESNFEKFREAILFLKSKFNSKVFFEPGKAIVGDAGYLIASVIDVFRVDGRSIAVLDTAVNHMPEVFEYQYRPKVLDSAKRGKYEYILAGSTCLSGDLFGTYRFDAPLEIGARLVFTEIGAYTLVKASMFNGINLPSVYSVDQNGDLKLRQQFGFEDYLRKCGGRNYVSI
jgi:carboxynorspermidine decarboxylase